MAQPVGPAEIQKILDVTDHLNIHRERVAIPLGARPGGRLRLLAGGRLEIVVDSGRPFDEWLADLAGKIREAAPGLVGLSPAAPPGRGGTPRGPTG
jgi:hypothetical protein